MRFPPSFLEEIRNRLPISDVVGSRVTWDKRKTNAARGDYWACCPFHGEKSPSFHAENRKGRYHCFGCGVSGDHFRFLVELDGISFPEAVERLAAQAGLAMPVMSREEREREEKRASLHDVMEMAARWFEDQLQGAAGAKARAYLRDRGLGMRTQQTFRLGYAPDSRNGLKEHLASKGVTKEQMEACGLVRHGPDIPVSYDWFRDRVMFPIPDSRGQIIAFGGRALRADVPAKYMNSPETDLFHKSNVLYNFARARQPAHARSQVIATEGYMDVIALHQAGFENAVAPLGTALTETQLELLWRMSETPVLCFDGDKAGLKAAWRAADLALAGLKPGRSVRFALLPEGKDPDDLVREGGPAAFSGVLEDAIGLADMVWSRETAAQTFDTPEKRATLEARLKEVVAQIRDENVRRHYQQDMSDRMGAFFGAPARTVRSEWRGRDNERGGNAFQGRSARSGHSVGRGRVAASPSLLNSPLVKRGSARIPLREAVLVVGVVHHPAILARWFDEFAALPLVSPAVRKVHQAVVDIAAHWEGEQPWPDAASLRAHLESEGHGETLERMDALLSGNRIWQALPDAAFEDAVDGWRQAHLLHLRSHTLSMELKAAEGALAVEDSEENLARLVEIRNEIEKEAGTEALIEGFGVPSGRPSRNF
ncbi:MAG: DNA primase [Nitratireductor sp.]|nr:DNA primase [Nitratireductor sp.]